MRALAALCLLASVAAPEPPNIVYILADDLGYAEVGCYGQTRIETPHIDRLAREGMRFTQHYSGSPVCAPSRCVLMTGLHTGHAYVRNNKGRPVAGQLPLPRNTVTVARLLQRAGYETCFVGKWGLGGPDTSGLPHLHGFDHFFGYLDQWNAHSHYPGYLWRNNEKLPLDGKTYSQDLFASEALEWISKRKEGDPFFLVLAPAIPHVSLHVPRKSLEQYRGRWPETPYKGGHYSGHETPRAAYAAMVSHLDRDIGRLMALLGERGLDDDTLVVFTSDNGPTYAGGADSRFFRSTGPLRGLKGSLYEGGIRVPMIARWPGKIRAGTATDHISAFQDVMPTLLELAGANPPEGIDGVSFAQALLGRGPRPEPRHLYWEHGKVQAVRMGDWKALRRIGKPVELYDLKSDIGETTNVAKEHPQVVARMAALMEESRTPSEHFPLFPPRPNWLGPEYWANRLQDWRRVGDRIECLSRLPLRTAHLLTHRIEGDFTLSVRLGGQGAGGVLIGTKSPLVCGVTGRGAGVLAGVGPDGRALVRDLARERLTVEALGFLPRDAWKIHSVDSEEPGQEGRFAIDGDEKTKWHSEWRRRKPDHPHWIVVDLGAKTSFDGFAYLPRRTAAPGRIDRYGFYISDDGKTWAEPVAEGRFGAGGALQRVKFPAGVTARFVRLYSASAHNNRPVAAVAELYLFKGEPPRPPDDVVLKVSRNGDALSVSVGASQATLRVANLSGGFALASHRGSFWFRDIEITGTQVDPERALGPVLSTQYTLSRGGLKLTAQLMPVRGTATLVAGDRKATAPVAVPGHTATFRLPDWDATRDTEYRVVFGDGEWKGTIRRDPVDRETIVLAALSCNHNNSHRIGREPFDWTTGVWFPHTDLTALVAKHTPDLLFFAGDQIYEGRSPSPADRANLELDYLYKWYLWCWAYRDLTRSTPCVTIPDDHDVFQGNLWGEGGRKTTRDSSGGYVHPAAFVRMVERTQTSHLPDPFDPTPVAQGIGVYYSQLVWGGVSFAILEDRKFKSGCAGRLPATGTRRPDHINDPRFDVRKADVAGLKLLGDRQLKFLDAWARDDRGVAMRAALSQTHFANMATHHGAGLQYLIADLDSNGWPQTGRRKALRALEKANAVHICGDQHLASVVRHGIDRFGDGPWAFCTPSIANFYPRKWWPKGAKSPLGRHLDGLGNRVTVRAVANPVRTGRGELHDGMPGFGIVRFFKRERKVTFECWPRHGGPQYEGWPVTIEVPR